MILCNSSTHARGHTGCGACPWRACALAVSMQRPHGASPEARSFRLHSIRLQIGTTMSQLRSVSTRSFGAAARGTSAAGAVLLLPLPAAGGSPAAASPSQRALHAGGGLRTATAAVSRRCLRCAPPAALRRGVLGKKLECMCVFRHPGWAGKSEEGVVMESLRGGRGGAQRAAQCRTGAETGGVVVGGARREWSP